MPEQSSFEFAPRVHTEHVVAPPVYSHGQFKRVAFIPDTHAPYHNRRAWALTMLALGKWKPDVLVVLGDLPDFYACSFHERSPGRLDNLQWELDETAACVRQLELLGAEDLHYCMGNHEQRWNRFLETKAGALAKLRCLDLSTQLDLSKWKVTPYLEQLRLGPLLVSHEWGKAGPRAHLQALADTLCSTAQGHTHHLGLSYGGAADGSARVNAAFGTLADLAQIDYVHKAVARRHWHNGFGVGYWLPSNAWHLQPVPIIDYRCILDGVLYVG